MSSNSGRSPDSSGVREEMVALLRDQNLMAHLYRSVGGGLGFDEARDLVHDAIGDLYVGAQVYNPDVMTPEEHVLQCARRERWRRTRDQVRLVPLSELADQDTPVTTHDEMTDPGPPVDPADLPELMQYLRLAAYDDPDVLSLLSAYDCGALRRAPVMALTGMSSATYHNARRRLQWLAPSLMELLDRKHRAPVQAAKVLPMCTAPRRTVPKRRAGDGQPAAHKRLA